MSELQEAAKEFLIESHENLDQLDIDLVDLEKSAAPSEGLPMYVSGFAIPKNAPNKEGGYAYMNAMLEKSAQENFAIDMGYNPTVTNATVAPDLQKRIGFTPEEQ